MNKRRRVRLLATFATASTLIVHPSSFGSPWTLMTADFQSRQVDVQGMTGEELTLAGTAGPERVPMGSVLELTRDAGNGAQGVRQGAFVVTLATGDRIGGTPAGIAGETLTWESPAVGTIMLNLRDVRALSKAPSPAALPDRPPAEDMVTLGNGDVVRGIVSGMADGKVTVAQSGGGEAVSVPMDSVASLVFASGAKTAAPMLARGFRVVLADGSALSAPAVSIAGEEVRLKLGDGSERKVPVSGVSAVEQVNGPVTFLSSLAPSEDVQRPYLGDAWPTRFDRSVTGQPLRMPGSSKVVARGIGVHAYSRLTYALDGTSYKTFRTRYAVEGGGPLANVTVRVLLDGKVAHERQDVTAATPAEVVSVPLNGAKTLTLEVDYGRSNDVQDRFAWLEPALVR